MEDQEPTPASTVAVLENDFLLRFILKRLPPADLVRAALTCHLWCGAASRVAPQAAPLLGYIFHPVDTSPPPPVSLIRERQEEAFYPAVFTPLAGAPRLSLDASGAFSVEDVHLGLVLLFPRSLPSGLLPRILALDPASRRRALLPPPPRDALPENDEWPGTRHVVGVAVLSRAHPSRLRFEAVCVTVDGDRPRAWVASVRDGDCTWRALPRGSADVKVTFDPYWFESRCVHAEGNVYWHICNSRRVLKLDPRALAFSYLLAPAGMGTRSGSQFCKFRVGETPEGDSRLCIATVEDEQLQLWVRGDVEDSDNGWVLVRQMGLKRVYDDSVPALPRDALRRALCVWIGDIDAGRTGKVFIRTWGYGHYSLNVDNRELQRLVTADGKDFGHPIHAYFLAWPPAFLATSTSQEGGD